MNPQEVLTVAEAISIEKRVPLETVFEAIESALAEATRRSYEEKQKMSIGVRIAVDRKSGEYSTFRTWEVREKHDDAEHEEGEGDSDAAAGRTDDAVRSTDATVRGIGAAGRGTGATARGISATARGTGATARGTGAAARGTGAAARGTGAAARGTGAAARGTGAAAWGAAAEDADEPAAFDPDLHLLPDDTRAAGLELGGSYEEPMENMEFGRVAAQYARQVMVRRVRDAERAQIREEYQNRIGELLNGSVDRVLRDGYILTLSDNVDAYLPRANTLSDERFHVGDTVRAILEELDAENHGPQLVLSRTSPAMLIELFRLEIPEVAERVIEIRAVAREPGSRAKIAVKTNDGRIDPVGVCVGMRGSRVLAVSDQLNGERVDIVLWDDNSAQLVINALAPAEVESVILDEESMTIEAVVKEESLAQAVGVRGENVRLASRLIGWQIDIMNVEQAAQKQHSESSRSAAGLAWKLDVEMAVGEQLQAAGLASLEDIALKPIEELTAIPGMDENMALAMQEKANDMLLQRELGDPDAAGEEEDAGGLLQLEGMDRKLLQVLAERGICTMEDLAEQAVDDLLEIEGMDEERAGFLIMTAREPWFAEQPLEGTDPQ